MHEAYRKWCTLDKSRLGSSYQINGYCHSTNRAGSPQITSLNASNQKEYVYVYIFIYMSHPQ